MNPKVLVAFATYDGYQYCINQFIDCISRLQYDRHTILCVDNSEKEQFAQYLRAKGIPTMRLIIDRKNTAPRDIILESRKRIRSHFLENDYDYLLSLDCDVMVPPNIITQLLAHHKDIVTGLYLFNPKINGKDEIHPLVFVPYDDEQAKLLTVSDALPNRLIEIAVSGWGCVLVKRAVLEQVNLRRLPATTEDVFFYIDAQKKGFRAYTDTSLKCFHMAYPEEDSRNELFKWENYLDKRGPQYSFSVSRG